MSARENRAYLPGASQISTRNTCFWIDTCSFCVHHIKNDLLYVFFDAALKVLFVCGEKQCFKWQNSHLKCFLLLFQSFSLILKIKTAVLWKYILSPILFYSKILHLRNIYFLHHVIKYWKRGNKQKCSPMYLLYHYVRRRKCFIKWRVLGHVLKEKIELACWEQLRYQL